MTYIPEYVIKMPLGITMLILMTLDFISFSNGEGLPYFQYTLILLIVYFIILFIMKKYGVRKDDEGGEPKI